MYALNSADRILTTRNITATGGGCAAVATSGPALGMCYCPFTASSLNLYALAFAAAQLSVARAEQHAADARFLAACN